MRTLVGLFFIGAGIGMLLWHRLREDQRIGIHTTWALKQLLEKE